MQRKFLFSIFSVLMIFCLTACGSDAEKPKFSADKSILGWAEEITIHSDDLHIRFSDSYSQRDPVSLRQA